MRPKRLTPPVRRTARRWRTPPAITTGAEAFEGMAVLDEIAGPLGFLLWQAARDVVLWAGFGPEEREGLFEPGADALLHGLIRSVGVDVQLESPLMTIVRMIGSPETARAETVELACQHIAHWADIHGHAASAIAFAQAAALTVPYDAGAAYAVGRIARRRAEYARAETWFRRAIALARQSGDWTSYALAFSGLGNLYMQRGSYPAARRFHIRALRAARRHSLRPIQGSALHDLFVIAAAGNKEEDAERYARGAFESYGPDHPRLPALANDIAFFWVERGHFAPALTVFEALLPHMTRQEDRLVCLANIVRAAAGAGERKQFEQTWDDVWDGLTRDPATENAAQVLVELAHGAAQLGEHERAERAADRAVKTARERGEAKTLMTAEAVLDSVRRSRGARGRAAAEAPRPEAPHETEMFATDLVRSLNASLVTR
jgi:tetratricopeptide (TPR) repeat protein